MRQRGTLSRSINVWPALIVSACLLSGMQCPPAVGPDGNQNANDNMNAELGWKDPGMPPWIEPSRLAVYEGKFYAAVYYSGDDGPRLAEFDGSNWKPTPGAPTDDVNALAVVGGKLYAGGIFADLGGVASGGLVSYTANGVADIFSPGIGGDDFVAVYAIAEYQGNPVIAGHFPSFATVGVQHICVLNGTTPVALDGGINGSARVDALLSQDDRLYVGGTFVAVGTSSLPVSNIAMWNGAEWSALAGGTNKRVNVLAAYDGKLLVGGEFSSVDGVTATGLALWNGTEWSAVPGGGVFDDLDATVGGIVTSLLVYNGDLIVAGVFARAGDVPANNIARFDGVSWHSLGDGLRHMDGGFAGDLAEFNGDLIVTGRFDNPSGTATPDIAVWGPIP